MATIPEPEIRSHYGVLDEMRPSELLGNSREEWNARGRWLFSAARAVHGPLAVGDHGRVSVCYLLYALGAACDPHTDRGLWPSQIRGIPWIAEPDGTYMSSGADLALAKEDDYSGELQWHPGGAQIRSDNVNLTDARHGATIPVIVGLTDKGQRIGTYCFMDRSFGQGFHQLCLDFDPGLLTTDYSSIQSFLQLVKQFAGFLGKLSEALAALSLLSGIPFPGLAALSVPEEWKALIDTVRTWILKALRKDPREVLTFLLGYVIPADWWDRLLGPEGCRIPTGEVGEIKKLLDLLGKTGTIPPGLTEKLTPFFKAVGDLSDFDVDSRKLGDEVIKRVLGAVVPPSFPTSLEELLLYLFPKKPHQVSGNPITRLGIGPGEFVVVSTGSFAHGEPVPDDPKLRLMKQYHDRWFAL